MTGWMEVGVLDDIPRRGARTISTAAGEVAIFRTGDDAVFALADRCPHRGGRLSQGIVHGRRVTCPLHNWVIDLEAGAAVAPDQGCVTRYRIKLEGGTLYLALAADAAA